MILTNFYHWIPCAWASEGKSKRNTRPPLNIQN